MPENARVSLCISILRQRSVKVVAFDMDQTAVAMHSRGRLRRGKALDAYLDLAVETFVALVPALAAAGFGLAIATHSDAAEYALQPEVSPETHILGEELCKCLLQRHFASEIVSSFLVIAYNPRVRGETTSEVNKIKRHHMNELRQHFDVESDKILFFDDTDHVVQDCLDHCGVQAIKVNPLNGLQWSDILNLKTDP